MNEDTILYIEVPCEKIVFNDPNSFNLHNDKKHWHEHINFFTYLSMQKLLDSCGFSIIKEKILNAEESLNCVNFSNIFMFACKKNKGIVQENNGVVQSTNVLPPSTNVPAQSVVITNPDF